MKISFFVSLASIILITNLCSCHKQKGWYVYQNQATGITDEIDTNILLYPAVISPYTRCVEINGKPLHFYQYDSLISLGNYRIELIGKKRGLLKLNFDPGVDEKIRSTQLDHNLFYLEPKSTATIPFNKKLTGFLPSELDTSVIINDQDNVPLKFCQYMPILFNGYGQLNMDSDGKYLWRYSEKFNRKLLKLTTSLDTGRKLQSCYISLLNADKILVLKSQRKMFLQRGQNNFLTFSCNLGRNPIGDKQQEGDGRTPEGSFTIAGQTDRAKYGMAFLISYPDSSHIIAARKRKVAPGGDIMVHTGNNSKINQKDWTNGCIALSNADMEKFFKYVQQGTPIEIRK